MTFTYMKAPDRITLGTRQSDRSNYDNNLPNTLYFRDLQDLILTIRRNILALASVVALYDP